MSIQMTKNKIIEQILKDFRTRVKESRAPLGDETGDEKEIVEVLKASLKSVEADESVRTCEDFHHLNVECCETCHTFYAHYEMSLIDLESGGNAWICCAMDRALNPGKLERFEQSPEYKQIVNMLGSGRSNA